MDDGLKQRLVGALVLLALGVLFVPVLFEPEQRRALDRNSQIPPAPGIEPIQVAEPVKNAQIASAKDEQEQFVEDDQSGGYRLLSDEEYATEVASPTQPEQVSDAVEAPVSVKVPEAEKSAAVKTPVVKTPAVKSSDDSTGRDLVAKQPEPNRKILDASGLPNAWVVQVASFTTDKRAQVLRDQLLQENYPAFTRTVKTAKGQVTRVYVGPKINRDTALTTKAELDKSLKIDALVVKFSP